MPSLLPQPRRSFGYGLIAMLVLAGVWRAALAVALPIVARDGATFCEYARDLGTQGVSYLRLPTTRQHPLFPATILAAQRIARLCGAADGPLTWQHSGQVVVWLAGMAVVGLTGALTLRLVRRLALPLDAHRAALVSMLLAAVLDLNTWLSADVMSDELHLAFYLGAVWLLLKLDTLPAAFGCGVLSGLAFLTRQEGLLPVLGGLVALVTRRRQLGAGRFATHAALLLIGFVVCAAPYWGAIGRFSSKKDPLDTLRGEVAAVLDHANAESETPLAQAKLQTFDVAWYALVPQALYKLLRAGRVVIPLLSIWPLISLRRRLLGSVLAGWTVCVAGHFALTILLLKRFGYLDVRHMLVIVMLLVPLAGMQLARGYALLADMHRAWLARALVAALVLPLAVYALRVPNRGDRYLAEAARWLSAEDPDLATQRLLSGAAPRRIAFYTGMRDTPWNEEPEDYPTLVELIRSNGRGYFALEVGPDFERRGNATLLDRLRQDRDVSPCLGRDHVRPGPAPQVQLHLIELRRAD